MASTFAASRSQVIFGFCVPLAVLVGYFLAQPLESTSMAVIVFILTALLLPLLVRWYHPLLILTWNAALTPFFLPGRPYVWMLVAGLGFIVALVNRSVDPDKRFLPGGGVAAALLFLVCVMAMTAACTGGIGVRAFGSQTYGGKKYFYLLAAILGYFVLTSQRIPLHRANMLVGLFFLTSLTTLVSNLAYMGGAKLYFLFELFPPEYVLGQEAGTAAPFGGVSRITGSMWAAVGFLGFLLARHGLRGLFDVKRPWRAVLLFGAFGLGLLSGYRSFVIMVGLIYAAAFFLEGLHRTRWVLLLVAASLLAGVGLAVFTNKLPLSAQRALSFLPVEVNPVVKNDAQGSTEWRLEMWRAVLPDVSRYLFRGKGYAVNPSDFYLGLESSARGFGGRADNAMLFADYHNGPLSILIPFGIWGMIGFLWFVIAAGRVLYLNYRYGDPSLHRINSALLAFFIGRCIFFLVFFGSFDSDMFVFTGLAGLSVSVNGGVRRASEVQPQPLLAQQGFA